MLTFQSCKLLPLLLCGSLIACATVPSGESKLNPSVNETDEAIAQPSKTQATQDLPTLSDPDKTKILTEVIRRQESLGVCDDSLNAEASQKYSEVYSGDDNLHLVQLLCFQAAYQGRYAFLQVDSSQSDLKIKSLNLELAGYPTYDPQTKIVSNGYKYTGVGACIEESEHRWFPDALFLIRSQQIENVEDGCPAVDDDYLITSQRVGIARIGDTFGQLKAKLGPEATFETVAMGVDLGEGQQVTQYGEVQYIVATEDGLPMTDDAIIARIRVLNPVYKTEKGVGAGTPIQEAIQHYGDATLSFNYENEGREYITFEQGIPQNMWLRSNQLGLGDFAGIYPESQESYQKTQQYQDKAAIGFITVSK